MYPLRFKPIFRRYLWGGRRLAEILNKPIGDQCAAESWEVVDHQDDQSVVAFGPLAGKSLRQLIADSGAELLGDSVLAAISDPAIPQHLQKRFPLLLKFLDANKDLSVQVHPDDSFGSTLNPPDLGKTEAWYVMHADPGAKIYAGLKSEITKEKFADAVEAGETESTLHRFEPRTGDCVFIPAGTIHAIGAGLLIAEIQQASNTTFRVFDWNRVDADGSPRPLHIQQAIEVTDFHRGPISATRPDQSGRNQSNDSERIKNDWRNLVACEKFVMNKASIDQPLQIAGDGRFHIVAVTKGCIEVENDPASDPLSMGQTMLIPASADAIELSPKMHGEAGEAEILEIYLPD